MVSPQRGLPKQNLWEDVRKVGSVGPLTNALHLRQLHLYSEVKTVGLRSACRPLSFNVT